MDIFGVSWNRTVLSGPSTDSVATGMLDSVVSSFGAVRVTSNVAFSDGSSQQGKARRASVASNCVVAM